MKKNLFSLLCLLCALFLFSCGAPDNTIQTEEFSGVLLYAQPEDTDASESNPDMTMITFLDDSVAIAGEGASAEDTTVRIDQSGMYFLSGRCSQGTVKIALSGGQSVHLVLSELNLSCMTEPCISLTGTGKLILTLAPGTSSSLHTDAADAICTDGALTVNGSGTLELSAPAGAGLQAGDTLLMMDGNLSISALTGMYSDTHLVFGGGFLSVDSIGRALSADTAKGSVLIYDGNLELSAGEYGIAAYELSAEGGVCRVTADGRAVACAHTSVTGGSFSAEERGKISSEV